MPKKSKLDAHTDWLTAELQKPPPAGELKHVAERLHNKFGMKISGGSLSSWWSKRQAELSDRSMQDRIIERLVSAQQLDSKVEQQAAGGEIVELRNLIRVAKARAMHLGVTGTDDPDMVAAFNDTLKTVVKHEELMTKRDVVALDRDKFVQSTKTAVDKALEQFAAVIKKHPALRDAYEKFRQQVIAAVEGATA